MKTKFTPSDISESLVCYTPDKLVALSFINQEEISLMDIINSEIPEADKWWFLLYACNLDDSWLIKAMSDVLRESISLAPADEQDKLHEALNLIISKNALNEYLTEASATLNTEELKDVTSIKDVMVRYYKSVQLIMRGEIKDMAFLIFNTNLKNVIGEESANKILKEVITSWETPFIPAYL
jgi:hypothetical protein